MDDSVVLKLVSDLQREAHSMGHPRHPPIDILFDGVRHPDEPWSVRFGAGKSGQGTIRWEIVRGPTLIEALMTARKMQVAAAPGPY